MRPVSRALLIVLIVAGCAPPAPLRPRTAADPEVRQLDVGTGTNAFLVMGERPILVDTGWGASSAKIERAIARAGVAPRDLALIVLTHGHGDHAGGAKRLRELSGAKVVSAAGDAAMERAGHNRPLRPMGFLGRLLRRLSDKPFPPFEADLLVDAPLDLRPYGVEGTVLPAPGHTPGSLAVLLETGDAIVGDMFRGGAMATHLPERHLFHDDCLAAEAHVIPLVQAGARRFFVGHGGPVDARAAADAFRDPPPCPGDNR
jgi:glyoxylase-like metal-dependent hydrolase (beta-lactamase superfamily II)